MAGPSDTDVIAAVATALGRAGIGIVRVSGKKLEQLASHLLGGVPAPRLAVRASFRAATGEPIDDGIALFFPAPASYTGEDEKCDAIVDRLTGIGRRCENEKCDGI